LAKRVAVKEVVRAKVIAPLGWLFGIRQDYFDEQFEADVARKMQDVPDENVTTPRLSVAGPVLQGLSYVVEERQLKEMYLELLARASDTRTQGEAHPAFAEIIRQLSSDEAKVLAEVLKQGSVAVAQVRLHVGQGFVVVRNHLLPLTADGAVVVDSRVAVWVDNWVRLGLVEVDYGFWLLAEHVYDWVAERPEYKELAEQQWPEGGSLGYQRGRLKVTDFGLHFLKVAVIGAGVAENSPAGCANREERF
jgi:hypothetical protein